MTRFYDLLPRESNGDELKGISMEAREEVVANAIVYCAKKNYFAFNFKNSDKDLSAAKSRVVKEAAELANYYAGSVRSGFTHLRAAFYETGDTLTVARPKSKSAEDTASVLVSGFQDVTGERPKTLDDAFKFVTGLRPQ